MINNQGSGPNGEYTFLDMLSIASFLIGLQNLDMNVDQNDMQDLQNTFNQTLDKTVNEIHQHLEVQDNKLDEILKRLEALENA